MLAPLRNLALIFAVASLTACSTHPLPEDFSRKTTVDIVKKMRCEISDGIKQLDGVRPEELEGTIIGFDFVMIMSEDNKMTGGKLQLTDPLARGTFTLDLGGSAEKGRLTERRFRMVDSMQKFKEEKLCSKAEQRANFVYPMAGNIGLGEIVMTYWKLKQIASFKAFKGGADDNRAFIDRIQFVTSLGAGINPTLDIKSTAGGLNISNASINGSVLRKDDHQVTVAIDQFVEVAEAPSSPARGSGLKKRADRSEPDIRPVIMFSPGAASNSVSDALNDAAARDNLRNYGVPIIRE